MKGVMLKHIISALVAVTVACTGYSFTEDEGDIGFFNYRDPNYLLVSAQKTDDSKRALYARMQVSVALPLVLDYVQLSVTQESESNVSTRFMPWRNTNTTNQLFVQFKEKGLWLVEGGYQNESSNYEAFEDSLDPDVDVDLYESQFTRGNVSSLFLSGRYLYDKLYQAKLKVWGVMNSDEATEVIVDNTGNFEVDVNSSYPYEDRSTVVGVKVRKHGAGLYGYLKLGPVYLWADYWNGRGQNVLKSNIDQGSSDANAFYVGLSLNDPS